MEGSAAWHQFASGWLPAIAIVAALSMVLGNLAALAQTNVKRLLAYSAIAHAGYALLGILANSEDVSIKKALETMLFPGLFCIYGHSVAVSPVLKSTPTSERRVK